MLLRLLISTCVAALTILFTHAPVSACSICRGGDQGFFINNARLLPAGKWMLALDNMYIERTALHVHPVYHSHGPSRADNPTVLQSQAQHGVQVVLNYGVSNRLMLSLSLPFVRNRITQTPDKFRIKGFGDPEVMAIMHVASFWANRLMLAASAGVRLPLGETDALDNYGFLLQPHDQIGSGAAAGIFGLQLNYANRRLPIFVSSSIEANSTSDLALRHGDIVRVNFAVQRRLSSRFDVIAETNTRNAELDWQGDTIIPNTGGSIIYFSPGMRFKLGRSVALRGQVQMPVRERLNGVQDEKTNLRGSFVWSL